MKLIFYISSLGHGGAERVISNLANYFSENSCNQIYLILERPIIKYEINSNINLITLEKKEKKYNFISKKARYIYYIFKLKKIFKKINPDAIISFLAVPAFMALIANKKEKSKVIVSVRNDPKTEYTTLLKKILMNYLYPKADGFVFQTSDAKKYFKSIICCPQTIIYNPVSKSFINNIMPSKRKKIIVAVGRLHSQKNYSLLIKAFKEISNKFFDYKLIIYGDGVEKDNIKKLILNCNLENKVFLKGNVDDIKSKIIDASLYVMTSNFEGMPNSLIEAMTLGLPVISTDCPCGGPKELIKNNINGVLVKVNDCKELVDAMDKVLSNSNFAMKIGNEAKKIVYKVDPKFINKEWEEFIRKIINRKGER